MGTGRILVIDNGTHYRSELERALTILGVPYRVEPAGAVLPGQEPGIAGIILTGGEVHLYEPAASDQVALSLTLIGEAAVPILGLCLGCQVIAWVNGAVIEPLPEPVDQPGDIEILTGDRLFAGVPSPTVMLMAHSDAIVSIGPDLVRLARSAFGEFEAVRHRTRPHYGVQFHPEVSGETGRRLLANFAAICGIDSGVRPTPV